MFFCTNFEIPIPKGAGNLASLHAFLATVKTIFSRMSRFFDQPAQMSAYGQFFSLKKWPFWPFGHFYGHQIDHKYENQCKYAMWGINLELMAPLIDLSYV